MYYVGSFLNVKTRIFETILYNQVAEIRIIRCKSDIKRKL